MTQLKCLYFVRKDIHMEKPGSDSIIWSGSQCSHFIFTLSLEPTTTDGFGFDLFFIFFIQCWCGIKHIPGVWEVLGTWMHHPLVSVSAVSSQQYQHTPLISQNPSLFFLYENILPFLLYNFLNLLSPFNFIHLPHNGWLFGRGVILNHRCDAASVPFPAIHESIYRTG